MPILKERIEKDFATALKNGDMISRDTLRLVKTAIKNREIEKGDQLSDEEIMAVFRKEIKMRQEAYEQFERAGRIKQAEKEQEEQRIIESYLPSPLDEIALRTIVEDAVRRLGATSPSDLGRVIKEVMSKVGGRAEGGQVAAIVREKLSARIK